MFEVFLGPIPFNRKRFKNHQGIFGASKSPNHIQMFYTCLIKTDKISVSSSRTNYFYWSLMRFWRSLNTTWRLQRKRTIRKRESMQFWVWWHWLMKLSLDKNSSKTATRSLACFLRQLKTTPLTREVTLVRLCERPACQRWLRFCIFTLKT